MYNYIIITGSCHAHISSMLFLSACCLVLLALYFQEGVLAQSPNFPLDCATDCILTTSTTVNSTTADNLQTCSCKNGTEVSSWCYAQFGWYEKALTPCQFASQTTTKFSLVFAWNNYKDCGGDTSPPCQYYNGTWISSNYFEQQLLPPFAWTTYEFTANTSNSVQSLWVTGSDVSGFGRLSVIPVY